MKFHRKKNRFSSCFALCLIAAHSMAVAAIVPVADDAVISIDGVNGETFTVDGVTRQNTYGTVLDFAGDATIKVVYPESVNDGGVYFGMIATNGTVTLDLTEIGDKTFALDNGASVKGKGLLIVKGRDSLCVGSKSAITENNYAPPADIVNVEYRDSADVVYQDPEGLVLVGRVLEWELPASTPWKLGADARPCIAQKDSKIIQSMIKDGVVALENREMWIYETDVFPTTATPVSVGAGSELVVILRKVDPETYFEQAGYSRYEFKNPIYVSEGGVLNLRSHYLTVSGAITGSGTLRYTETSKSSDYWTKVVDASGFSGHVSCELSNLTLHFGNGSFGGHVSMTLCDGCSVEIGYNEVSAYTTTIGALSSPESGSASLAFSGAESASVSIASKTGNVSISGAGYGKTTVTIPSIAVGETLVVDGNETFKLALTDDFASRSDVFVLTRTNGRNVYLRSASSELIDFLAFDVPEGGEYKLVAKNGITYRNVPENVQVTVPEGVSATVSVACASKGNIRMEGGTLSVARAEPDWRSKVIFWMDPSDADSVVSSSARTLSGISYPTVSGMNDTRVSQTETKLVPHKDVESTWPTLITNGVNGLSYLSCDMDGARRLWFGDNNGIVTKYAIMVFGSQLGGGQGIIGNINGYYARGGELSTSITKDSPIFASNITTYVNGNLLDDPRTRSLSGGWEIISFDTSSAVVHGFGFNKGLGTKENCRGQNYGEVLLFSETPTEEERVAAEKYLAAKWGLAGDYNGISSDPELRVVGDGVISLDDDVSISGSFAGTVNLNGRSLVVQDGVLPPADDVVVSNGRLAWFDPDHAGSVLSNSDKINYIYDRARGNEDGAPVLNGSGRTPMLVSGARGFGSSRKWVDYSPAWFWTEKNSNYGRTLRLNQLPTLNSTVVPLSAKTVFVVQDSVKGGGSAFLSAVNGTGDILSRLTKWPEVSPDPGIPVWRDTTASIFANDGATYLDGRKIDGSVDGFQGRPELLTAVGNKNFNLGAFGYYNYLQDVEDNVDFGEVQGEIIVYDRALGDAERKSIEAYLMWKWLGVARDGYSVATNMTVTGNGSLSVASSVQMPKIGESFTGGISMDEDEFSFMVDSEGSVSGHLDMGSASVTFPKNCTANVGFAGGVKTGTYALVSCGSIADGTVWSLNLTTPTGRKAAIVQNGGTVVLEVTSPGTVITIK